MAVASIPVDLLNPGQVFASLGLMELAEVLCGGAEAGFDWSDTASPRFLLSARGTDDPITVGLQFLARATVYSLAPDGTDLDTAKWKVPSHRLQPGSAFPIPRPSSPASLPAVLEADGRTFVVGSWGDAQHPQTLSTRRDNAKFWAGSAGYPGTALLRDALDAVRDRVEASRADPFGLSAPQSSSFRFDWRRDYVPLDAGFSLNEHGRILPRGYPLVEILAAVGLAHARPHRLKKLLYRYGVIGRQDREETGAVALVPPEFLRAALGTAALPFPKRTFTMHLGWPSKENQARCITTVFEETSHDDPEHQ